MSRCLRFALALVVLSCGCASNVVILERQAKTPVFITSYKGALIVSRAGEVSCALNCLNVAEKGMLTELCLGGSRDPGPDYPIRLIVSDEFTNVIHSNFKPVAKAEQARLELKVESRRITLDRDGDDLVYYLSLAVHLLNPNHQDKPYFSKVYEARTIGTMMSETTVPDCVYEAVQQIASAFVTDVNANTSLLERLHDLGN